MAVKGNIRVGTSGWHYPHWSGVYYPRDLPRVDWLSHYARDFACVELNNSFYRLPSAEAIAGWTRQTPATFSFAVKASRSITHLHKLQKCDRPLDLLLARAALFGPRLGPLLFQLPPRWHANPERLDAFLALLPQGRRYVFEFRDPSWHSREILGLLEARNIAFCQFDLAGEQTPPLVSADFVYVRLHGPGEAYRGSYSKASLSRRAGQAHDWSAEGRDVYVFFDNDEQARAVNDAKRLLQLLSGNG